MDLRDFLGLQMKSANKELQYDPKEIHVKDVIKYTARELAQFTLNPELNDQEIYRVYKEVYKIVDKENWSEVEYSILILQNGMIGEEYKKTIGYYRSKSENGFRFPEVFQLVDGYIEVLLQRPGQSSTKIKDVLLVRLQRMEILVIPPSYGITLINPSEKQAIIARLRASEAKEIHTEYKQTKGECYIKAESGKWEYNENYDEIPTMRLVEAPLKWKTIRRGMPIYNSFIYNPNLLRMLTEPDPSAFNI